MNEIGLRPTKVDPKDKPFRFYKLFGAVTEFEDEYDADAELTDPDQNDDGRPSACTGYTVADICTDEDKIVYSPTYNLMKTFEIMNVPSSTEGADLRAAFKVPCSFGPLPLILEPMDIKNSSQAWAANQANWPVLLDTEARKNQKITYLPIYPGVQDWFDSVRTALVIGKKERRTVGLGTRWSNYFTMKPDGSILPENVPSFYWGHAYKISGWKTINGVPYLKVKPWMGKKRYYMSRSLCNRLMSEWGAYGATLQDLPTGTVEELKQRQITLLEVLIALYKNLIIRMRYGFY